MSETYVECLVQRKPSIIGNICRWILTILAGLFLIYGVLTSTVIFFVGVVFGVGAYLVMRFTNIEFEYLYLDKEITVDKIMNKTKRKKAATFEVDRIEIIAPINSHALDSYRNRTAKEKDFSTGIIAQPDTRFVMYYNGEDRIVFSPSESLLKAVKTVAPRKVFLD